MSKGSKNSLQSVIPVTENWFMGGSWKIVSSANSTGYSLQETWSFPSPRPRPLCSSNTQASLSRIYNNRNVIRLYSSPLQYREGPIAAICRTDHLVTRTVADGDISAASNRAKYKLNKPDLNLSVFLGEGRETAKLLTETAQRLAKAYAAFKSGNRKEAYRILSSQVSRRQDASIRETINLSGASSAWLQYSFGWTPLVQDVYNAVIRDWERMEKGKVLTGWGASGPNQKDLDIFDPARVPRATAGWRGTVSVPNAAWLQSLGMLNPLQLAWELRPLSFVTDWFLNISTLLGGITSTAGLTCVSSWYISETHTDTLSKEGYVKRRYINVHRHAGVPPRVAPSHFGLGAWHFTTSLALLKRTFSGR